MASTKRLNRVSEEIKKCVSEMLVKELDIQALRLITITRVKLTPDLSLANIYYTNFTGSSTDSSDAEKAFKISRKKIRMLLSQKLRIRQVPELRFFYDDTLDQAYKIEDLIRSIKKD